MLHGSVSHKVSSVTSAAVISLFICPPIELTHVSRRGQWLSGSLDCRKDCLSWEVPFGTKILLTRVAKRNRLRSGGALKFREKLFGQQRTKKALDLFDCRKDFL